MNERLTTTMREHSTERLRIEDDIEAMRAQLDDLTVRAASKVSEFSQCEKQQDDKLMQAYHASQFHVGETEENSGSYVLCLVSSRLTAG